MELNKIFYENDYSKAYEYVIANNYRIIEIEPIDNMRRFKIVEIPKPSKYMQYSTELENLKIWFDVDYARLEQKYRRLYTLKLYCDDGSYPYDKLIDLYNEAEYKRARIKELERLISNEVV